MDSDMPAVYSVTINATRAENFQRYYKLDAEGNVIPARDHWDWAQWFETASADKTRILAHDRVGRYFVSTVFLGLDHSFGLGTEPLIFETMIFDEQAPGLKAYEELHMCRYSTREQALAGHAKAMEIAKALVEELPMNRKN